MDFVGAPHRSRPPHLRASKTSSGIDDAQDRRYGPGHCFDLVDLSLETAMEHARRTGRRRRGIAVTAMLLIASLVAGACVLSVPGVLQLVRRLRDVRAASGKN